MVKCFILYGFNIISLLVFLILYELPANSSSIKRENDKSFNRIVFRRLNPSKMNEESIEEIIAEPNEDTWASSVVAGLEMLQGNAWYIAGTACLIYYFWINKYSARYRQWKERRKLNENMAKLKKDPEIEFKREEARMSAINKLQEQYNEMALKAKEIEKEKEKKKRQKSIEKLKLSEGRKLGDVKNYYPLSGQGSRSYKVSSRRTTCQSGC